jgi:hypothetical protein
MYLKCTSNVPQMYLKCTSNVPQMYLKCTSNVPQMYLTCKKFKLFVNHTFLSCLYLFKITVFCFKQNCNQNTFLVIYNFQISIVRQPFLILFIILNKILLGQILNQTCNIRSKIKCATFDLKISCCVQ